ncbi:MAG TPA: hypothetical protein VHW70_16295, partial [Edaphobacter sp.]|nr:hypothetical protein [Edaphobacter sp.]
MGCFARAIPIEEEEDLVLCGKALESTREKALHSPEYSKPQLQYAELTEIASCAGIQTLQVGVKHTERRADVKGYRRAESAEAVMPRMI